MKDFCYTTLKEILITPQYSKRIKHKPKIQNLQQEQDYKYADYSNCKWQNQLKQAFIRVAN